MRGYLAGAVDAEAVRKARDGGVVVINRRAFRSTDLYWHMPALSRSLKYDKMKAAAILRSLVSTLAARVVLRTPAGQVPETARVIQRPIERRASSSGLYKFTALW